ncbi:hypothetical protein GTA62_14590 [Roseobacter sp. HKCCD9010]|uniref:hypothetical protein n=1 Tax=unclassified Roseobacter TaxID=196798 RepID=UPI001492E40A|nr:MULTISPECIES: hypothetical protein [unclassified Roseobacter]MBF9050662.1 hypothetical protein [Rhodobacterales bacterium HKCCD4356]NNY41834.1 hypothetical protein [Roseobacter sp. HKCCD8831]NOB47265.1 hypothetical protein [Roseobacter sp. HKCCD9039]NOB94108.1 hypothetical protein [Roseobacter sp. HKCCD5914]NNV11920.1 hypothetical protein [Roseobacter sp. HKCCD7357]
MTEPSDLRKPTRRLSGLSASEPTKQEQQIQELQDDLADEKDARREDQFVFIVIVVILFDIVFFTLMPTFGGPLALLVLQLLILIPLARRMGMEEIARILNGVINRLAGKTGNGE